MNCATCLKFIICRILLMLPLYLFLERGFCHVTSVLGRGHLLQEGGTCLLPVVIVLSASLHNIFRFVKINYN